MGLAVSSLGLFVSLTFSSAHPVPFPSFLQVLISYKRHAQPALPWCWLPENPTHTHRVKQGCPWAPPELHYQQAPHTDASSDGKAPRQRKLTLSNVGQLVPSPSLGFLTYSRPEAMELCGLQGSIKTVRAPVQPEQLCFDLFYVLRISFEIGALQLYVFLRNMIRRPLPSATFYDALSSE